MVCKPSPVQLSGRSRSTCLVEVSLRCFLLMPSLAGATHIDRNPCVVPCTGGLHLTHHHRCESTRGAHQCCTSEILRGFDSPFPGIWSHWMFPRKSRKAKLLYNTPNIVFECWRRSKNGRKRPFAKSAERRSIEQGPQNSQTPQIPDAANSEILVFLEF